MRSVRRVRDPAWQLFHGEQFRIQSENVAVRALRQRKETESHRRVVAHLFFAARKIDGPFIESTWRACLESSHFKAELTKRLAVVTAGEAQKRFFARSAMGADPTAETRGLAPLKGRHCQAVPRSA